MRIASVRSNIREVENFLLSLHEHEHFPEDLLDRIMIAVTEAVNNGIIHGNRCNPDTHVDLVFTLGDGFYEFVVRDQGPGFMRESLPDPLNETNLLKEGGRGVMIIEALMDEVHYTQHKDGLELRMRIFRNTEQS